MLHNFFKGRLKMNIHLFISTEIILLSIKIKVITQNKEEENVLQVAGFAVLLNFPFFKD